MLYEKNVEDEISYQATGLTDDRRWLERGDELGIDVFWGALPHSQLDLQHLHPEYYPWDVTVDDGGLEWLSVTCSGS